MVQQPQSLRHTQSSQEGRPFSPFQPCSSSSSKVRQLSVNGAVYVQSKSHCQLESQVFSVRGTVLPKGARDAMSRRGVKLNFESIGSQGFALALGVVCLLGLSARAQVADSTPKKAPATRLLTLKEGRSIVNVALEQQQPARGTQDCSHLTHQIYTSAGFE